jgi:hypothetical protein
MSALDANDLETGETADTGEDADHGWRLAHTSLGFETFQLEGPAAYMHPSKVMAALTLGLHLRSDEVGVVTPERPDTVSLEVARPRAAVLSTPRDLVVRLDGRPALFTLRRPTDEPEVFETGRADALVTFDGPTPTPGALIGALAPALGLAGEDLGLGLEGAGFLRISLPLSALVRITSGLEVTAGETRLRVESLTKKP